MTLRWFAGFRSVSHPFAFMLMVSAVGAPTITITGPIEGNPAFNRAQYSLKDVGYVEEEFFFSGTATSYKSAG
jgi:hypothetical protein